MKGEQTYPQRCGPRADVSDDAHAIKLHVALGPGRLAPTSAGILIKNAKRPYARHNSRRKWRDPTRIGFGRRASPAYDFNRAPMPNLERLKKQAKRYLRWRREGHSPVAAQSRCFLASGASRTMVMARPIAPSAGSHE